MLDFITIVITKEQVDAEDTSGPLGSFKKLIQSPEIARSYKERVDIVFHGYDDRNEELFEIPEVRNYVYKLDEEFPFWLYFLSKHHLGLQALVLCFLPPYLTDEAKARILPGEINDLLTKRWFPALNHIGEYVGMQDHENEDITNRSLEYIFKGPAAM